VVTSDSGAGRVTGADDRATAGDPGTSGDRCAIKDLCIDVSDPSTMAAFWAATLGLVPTELDGGLHRLDDGVTQHTVWINPVPEARTVKQRVHLDVLVADVAELVGRGARVVDELPHWTVLADPEGGELCAFVRPPERLTSYRLLEVVVDAVDPEAITAWWGDRLRCTPRSSDDGSYWWLDPGPGVPVAWVFQAVPEPKSVKNRIHWDVLGETDGLVGAGATLMRGRGDGRHWDVLADPEGNEFCVFPPG
jgi:hypothetical protein